MNHYIGFVATNNASSISLLYRTIRREIGDEEPKMNEMHTDENYIISEKQVKKIVRETIKEMLGGIA